MTMTTNFSIEGLDNLMNNDWRWSFREDPKKWFETLQSALHGIPTEFIHKFYKGLFDAKVEGDSILFVESGKDLTNEIVDWMLKQFVECGESVEIYFEGLANPERLVNRQDFDYTEDYLEEINQTRTLYRNYYDKSVEKFKATKSALEWVYKNWGGRTTLPKIRTFKEMQRDEDIKELRCTDFTAVDYHALLLDVDGKVWWYGEESSYSPLQHMELHDTLRKLGINSVDYSLDGPSDIAYDPNYKWRLSFSNITKPQIETLIEFALDRGEDHIIVYTDDKISLEKLISFLNDEIQWHEI